MQQACWTSRQYAQSPLQPLLVGLRISTDSSYTQLLHITAWSLCFLNNLKANKDKAPLLHTPSLSLSEINSAEILLFPFSQQRFNKEIRRIAAGKSLRLSSLLSLKPNIGSGGLLVVGGRLKNSSLSPSQNHRIILHGKDALTNLLVCSKLLHSGPALLLSVLGTNLHIIGASRLVRSVCRNCITCRKIAATPQ